MKLGEVFQSNYLTSADLQQQDVPVTIKGVEAKEFETDKGGKDMKLIISFRELDKSLVCNKTNATTISELYTDETDNWTGKRITLYETEVEFGGKTTMGIRVRLRPPAGSAAPGNGISDPLKVAKQRAWGEFLKNHGKAGETQMATATRLKDRISAVFNKTPEQLTAAEWTKLIECNFEKPLEQQAEEIFGGEGVPADEIPF